MFALSFTEFAKLMGKSEHNMKRNRNREHSDSQINVAIEKLKENFVGLYGISFEDAKENLDLNHLKRNVRRLMKCEDVQLGRSGAKRKRKSLNESLNESFLGNFENATVSENDSESELIELWLYQLGTWLYQQDCIEPILRKVKADQKLNGEERKQLKLLRDREYYDFIFCEN